MSGDNLVKNFCIDFVRQIHNKVCWPFVGSTTMSDICRILQAWISSTCSAQNRAEKTLDKLTTIGNDTVGRERRIDKTTTCSARQTSHIVVQATKNVARHSWSVARRTTFMVWAPGSTKPQHEAFKERRTKKSFLHVGTAEQLAVFRSS